MKISIGYNNMLGAKLIVRKATTFRRLTLADQKLAFAAFGILAEVQVALWLLPFQRVMRLFVNSDVRRTAGKGYTSQKVVWAVRLAIRYVPGATCLPQALTTYILLGRYGHPSCLHVGVASAPKFEAHAWVECDGKVVIGGWEKLDRFASILILDTRKS